MSVFTAKISSSREEALDSFRSFICPHCGERKKPNMNLCPTDYALLPNELQWRLYPRSLEILAPINAALEWLEVHFPSKYGFPEP